IHSITIGYAIFPRSLHALAQPLLLLSSGRPPPRPSPPPGTTRRGDLHRAGRPASVCIMAPLFRYPDGPVPNLLALGYAVGGYLLGMGLILAPPLALNLAGTLLLAHAMVIA